MVFGERRLPNAPAIPHSASLVDVSLPYEIARRQAIDAFERDSVAMQIVFDAARAARAAAIAAAPVPARSDAIRHRRLARGSSHDLAFDGEITAGRRSVKRITSVLPDDRTFQGSNS